MKIVRGLNPDFADFDEIDVDIEEAYEEFKNGRISYDQLKANVGPEAAQAHADRIHGMDDSADDHYDIDSLFDDPEDL